MALFITTDDQQMLLDWAADRVDLGPGIRWPSEAVAVAVRDMDDFTVYGVMVTVETYRGVIDMHFASDGTKRWATRQSLGMLFQYLFLIRGARRVQTIHSANHFAKSSIVMRLGFKPEGQLRSAIAPGQDGIMFGMTASDCRYLDNRRED